MKLWKRLRYFVRRDHLREEMDSHLAFRADELMERGLSAAQARAQAQREFGNALQHAEASREIWLQRWLADFLQDLRFASRTLAKSPAFATVAILSAALGIGACSTIFGIANFLTSTRLPVSEPDRLLSLTGGFGKQAGGNSLSYPELTDLRRARSLDGVAGMFILAAGSFTTGVESHRHWGSLVTANFFDVVRPGFAAGRGFDAARDDTPGAPPVIVLSYSLWQSRFGGDPSLIGRTVRWNGQPVTVLGVTAPGFRGTEQLIVSEFWIPFSLQSAIPSLSRDDQRMTARGHSWLMAVARLAPERSLSEARSEMRVLAAALQKQFPEQKDRHFHLQRAGEVNAGAQSLLLAFFLLLSAVTVLVLLVASANVANLLLARGASRHKEIATRLAIGAGRGRLIRQLLAESLLLSFCGGLAGALLAWFAASLIGRVQLPMPLPLDFTIHLDYRVLLFSIALSFVTGLFFGLLPAWRASRADLSGALKNESVTLLRGRRLNLRQVLVVAQVAISLVLLICSGLFLRSLYAASHLDLGMTTRDVLFLSVDPTLNRYTPAQTREFFVQLLLRLRQLPGVQAASVTHTVPLSIGGTNTTLRPRNGQPEFSVSVFLVAPGYFDSLGIRLPRGADFRGDRSDAQLVILNQSAARQLFGPADPLGQSVDYQGRAYRVGGLAADSKLRQIGEDPRAAIYLPLLEHFATEDSLVGYSLIVRSRGNAASLAAPVQAAIRALDPSLATFDLKTIETHLERALMPPRLAAFLFGFCGAIALILSTIGLYGVISFTVAQRTKEIGIRLALGTAQSQVLLAILRGGLALALTGIVIGLAASFALSRVAASLLLGISPTDAITFLAVPALLLAVALLASLVPACRAASLDPLRTLRYE